MAATATTTVLQQPSHFGTPQQHAIHSMAASTTSATGGISLEQSQLCLVCKSIFDGLTPRNEYGEVTHYGLEALFTSASRGCHLCLTVSQSIDPDQFSSFQNRLAKGERVESWGFAAVSPIARDQARIRFRYLRTKRTEEEVYEGMSTSEKRKTRMMMSTPSSMDLSSGSTSSDGGKAKREQMPILVELILMNPKYAVEPGVRKISLESIHTGSAESFDIAKKWIDECMFNHMKCSVNDGAGPIWKPTHLLDVSVKGPKGAPGIKLVDGMFLDAFTEYVTLSHVWGRSKAIRLHKGTLKALRQGVAINSLPKTFSEAAMVADKLGYRYLWIDALCIMHDNETAVLKEIGEMNKIYSNASLNIAATSSRDDSAGLIYPRNVMALQPCVVEANGVGVADGMYKILRSTVWHDLVDTSPLAKRAWVVQERCLAKRTLHFTRTELLWECQQMCCSEVFPKGLPATMTAPAGKDSVEFFNKRTHHQRHGNWHQLVNLYSRGRLSYTSDKLLAVSGLAKQYMSRNRLREADYLVGLWKPQLPQALLWRTDRGKRPLKYRAPSWSWASIEGDIAHPETAQAAKETCLEVIDSEVKHKADPFGQVEAGAKLKVRGFMARGLLPRTKDYWGQVSCEIQCKQSSSSSSSPLSLELENAYFDEDLPKLSDPAAGVGMIEHLQVYLLPVIDVMDRVEGLILCSNIKKGEFRRIGAFEVSRYDQANWDRFRAVMKGDPEMNNYEERLDHTNGYWFASDYTYTVNLV
ncbi:uncharacterized protein HMPREF1541_06722 [Cyphellophora europaea CBS 101466]|uniref:Heterokaryon incompatibility domain-containing protein n=1 Tax=Cyphellophora europaea (strain CBS 101466) TaxID=1220924 RepID=W2RQT4_CYPE1|nr:uncharacterized protein HMPREF1541_06722 [Cyphellophora europaea CBS 101466]ETN38685.1 hypothetical protein HMPREF1541_06722 [Cyphellophora europaea CBS 101466]